MRLELKQEMGLDGAISLMSSNSLLGPKVYFRNKREYQKFIKLSFLFSETPKQLPIEPEKTPAPSKSGDFHHFSGAAGPQAGHKPRLLLGSVLLVIFCLEKKWF